MASGERSGRSTVVRFLGLRCDSLLQAFLLPDDKKLTFETLREKTLFSPSVGFFCNNNNNNDNNNNNNNFINLLKEAFQLNSKCQISKFSFQKIPLKSVVLFLL